MHLDKNCNYLKQGLLLQKEKGCTKTYYLIRQQHKSTLNYLKNYIGEVFHKLTRDGKKGFNDNLTIKMKDNSYYKNGINMVKKTYIYCDLNYQNNTYI